MNLYFQVGNGADIHAQEDMLVESVVLAGDGASAAILSIYLTDTAISPAVVTLKCPATEGRQFFLHGLHIPYNALFDENGTTCIYTVFYKAVDQRPGEG